MDTLHFSIIKNGTARELAITFIGILNLLFLLFLLLPVHTYESLYYATLFLLLISALVLKSDGSKALLLFFAVYYGISLMPGSTYRGIITLYTLQLYSISIFITSVILLFSELFQKKELDPLQYKLTSTFIVVYILQMVVIYAVLAYVLAKHGLIIINQEERFGLDASLSYILKSGIYVPVILTVVKNKPKRFNVLLYYVIPFLPALFIGSRGTVIMILLAVLIAERLKNSAQTPVEQSVMKTSNNIKLIAIAALAGLIITGFFYIRRQNSTLLKSADIIMNMYFENPGNITYAVAPLHFALREQIGITDYIINHKLEGNMGYPMFIADFFTLLPGKQDAAGIRLNYMMSGNTHAGLTPGVLGAFYLDYKSLAVLAIPLMVLLMNMIFLPFKRISGLNIVLYSLTLTQFFHVFHRGFLKPEYLFAYVIVGVYFLFLSKERV